MAEHSMPTPLRWLYFVIGAGALVACGIYLGTAAAEGFPTWRILRAVMFGLIGIFGVLRYGESKRARGSDG